MAFEEFDHPAWVTAATTLTSYALAILVLFVLLFVLPYLAFVADLV